MTWLSPVLVFLFVGVLMLDTMAGIITALAGPVASPVMAIASGAVVDVWLYETYQKSWVVLSNYGFHFKDATFRRPTAYLVD